VQEAAADELEEAYRSEVWNPSRGRLNFQKGIPLHAAKVDLQTLANKAKVKPSRIPPYHAHAGEYDIR